MFMATKRALFRILLLFLSFISQSCCQSGFPLNIETFYPFGLPPVGRTPNFTHNKHTPPSSNPPPPLSSPPPLPLPPQVSVPRSSSSKSTVVKAVAATAASSLVISILFFFLLHKYKNRSKVENLGANFNSAVPPNDEFVRFDGNIRGLIVDENGLDVLYWKKMEDEGSLNKGIVVNNKGIEAKEKAVGKGKKPEPVQELPLLRGKSSTSQSPVWAVANQTRSISVGKALRDVSPTRTSPRPWMPMEEIHQSRNFSEPSPLKSPPPPPMPGKNPPLSHPPPPPPISSCVDSNTRPAPPKGNNADDGKLDKTSPADDATRNGSNQQVKLKPLHWDKVNPKVDQSMVWDKVNGGSFRFDGDLMEALFGYVATNRKSPKREGNSANSTLERSGQPSQIFILDTRKSQNAAIVIRSLGTSRKEIVKALSEGQGLSAETLERLTKIAPTKEEESEILAFGGDPAILADAESFLYYLLRAVPTAFTRFNAMLFRSNYDSDVLHFKESLRTLESACKELRSRGLFLKLLEAVLKAGNRMNAGTSRGNAQAFALTALLKLSDVKSTDGKTTLLRFVVEEVVRAEGKRCVLNRNRNLGHNSSTGNSNALDSMPNIDGQEKEYMMLGLPVVGGLSSEFINAKKAAAIDYNFFSKTCYHLSAHASQLGELLSRCVGLKEGEGFVKEMKGFLANAQEEINVLKEEQTRVMEHVMKTTEYYQSGASIDKGTQPFQLFIIVRDFLVMVDHVCVDIARNKQRMRAPAAKAPESLSNSQPTRISVRFPKLPPNFLSESSTGLVSDSFRIM